MCFYDEASDETVILKGGGGEGSKSESHLGDFFQIISTPGESDKLPNPRKESQSSVPLLPLHLYVVRSGEK
jgi:hypothetical protein